MFYILNRECWHGYFKYNMFGQLRLLLVKCVVTWLNLSSGVEFLANSKSYMYSCRLVARNTVNLFRHLLFSCQKVCVYIL